jgi:DUF1680 family protein
VNRFKSSYSGASWKRLMIGLASCAVTAVSATALADPVKDRYVPAPTGAQTIGGVLGARIDTSIQKHMLDRMDLDALLEGYRHRPGKQVWVGEHIGKFIDAASNAWAYSGDERLKSKLGAAVEGLLATQEADGYLGTYLAKDRFVDFGDADWKPSEALPLWDVWVHKYNLIGLLTYYVKTGDKRALAASRRIGDLLSRTYGEGAGQKSIARNDWHGGMANGSVLGPMAELYRITGDERYLEFCRYVVRAWNEPKGPKIVSTLLRTGKVVDVANGKAYEMMSSLVGLLMLYRVTAEDAFLKPVLMAWQDIVDNRLYISGSASWGEHFRPDHLLRADGTVGEGCVTTTWMQVNLELLRLTGEAKYASELERTIYNALLAAQHPANGLICYFVPLNGRKDFGAVSHGIPGVSCCTSSITRGLALIPPAVWGLRNGGIAVNLYVPGTVRMPLSGTEVTLASATRFPIDGAVELHVTTTKPARFPLMLRVPEWCRKFVVTAGGQTWTGRPGTYLEIERNWKDSQRVSVQMDLTAQAIDGGPAYPEFIGVQRGPQVLAADARMNPGVDLWIAGLAEASRIELEEGEGQMYRIRGYTGNERLGKKPVKLVLLPLAEAGQQGGEYRVWLRRP